MHCQPTVHAICAKVFIFNTVLEHTKHITGLSCTSIYCQGVHVCAVYTAGYCTYNALPGCQLLQCMPCLTLFPYTTKVPYTVAKVDSLQGIVHAVTLAVYTATHSLAIYILVHDKPVVYLVCLSTTLNKTLALTAHTEKPWLAVHVNVNQLTSNFIVCSTYKNLGSTCRETDFPSLGVRF